MVDAKERIWAVTDAGMIGTGRWVTQGTENPHGNVEYVRADLYEQVKRERDDAQKLADSNYANICTQHRQIEDLTARAETAERLAGVRVKALDWRGTEGVWAKADALFGATYRITEYAGMAKPFKLETVGFVGPSGHYELIDAAKAAAQADYEHRIISALAEPAGEFDRIVSDSSEFVASLSDSMRATGRSVFNPPEPAGEVEPMAWCRKWNFRGHPCEDEFTDSAALAEQWRTHPQTDEVIALYTTPPDASAIRGAATHRHKKRGTKYVLIGIGKVQAERWYQKTEGIGFAGVDMREVAVYRSVDDGSLWVRPREEFEDGRFEALVGAKP